MKKLFYLWQKHRLLLVGFSLASMVTLFFLVRFSLSLFYWSNHQDTQIEAWMPVGYIARSYDVDRDWLMQQTGLPAEQYRPRLSIEDAARNAGIGFEDMRAQLLQAIKAKRSE